MTLQLQPGKWYRQRDGGKAYVAAELPEELVLMEDCLYRFVGVDRDGRLTSWRPGGLFLSGPGHNYDLVSEWVDEPTDAEIANAARWCAENRIGVKVTGEIVKNSDSAPVLSVREFVNAVNEYRAREGA